MQRAAKENSCPRIDLILAAKQNMKRQTKTVRENRDVIGGLIFAAFIVGLIVTASLSDRSISKDIKDLEERIKTLEDHQEAAQEKEQMNEADDACGH